MPHDSPTASFGPGGHKEFPASAAERSGPDAQRQSGDMIGQYRVLERLGEGGFGVVYLAEQSAPVRRRVALKVIKPGMDSKAVIARFEAERQALAMMSHPNVAKILDAGTTPHDAPGGGRPYFVMEHVKGEPITEYCDRHRLTVEQRLKLFMVVCEAVQHAHMKGIIHRDLKPSNILVTIEGGAEPRPVVIDFGVAKALAGRLTDQTIYTERGMLIGTPEYMSPEQAEMADGDIDTRTDVYSLGVILYELLAGEVPFATKTLRAAGHAAIQKMIREAEPPRPSTKLSTLGETKTAVAAARHMALDDLTSQLRRELEWIPLKALRKDRAERYRSASELADDVGNYLAQRPLVAGPETAGYKFRKFARRNKGAVAAVASIALTLVLATGVSVWFGLEARAQRASAQASESKAKAQATIAEANAAEARKQAALAIANAEAEFKARSRAEDSEAFSVCGSFDVALGELTLTRMLTPGAVRHVRRLAGVRSLRFDQFQGTMDEMIGFLVAKDSPLASLTALDLSNTLTFDSGVAALAASGSALTGLTALDLRATQIGDAALALIAERGSTLATLKTLNLNSTLIADEGLAFLAAPGSAVSALASLDLRGSRVGDAGVVALAARGSAMANLTILDLAATRISDAGAVALAAQGSAMGNLTTLSLAGTAFSDQGAAALAAKDSAFSKLTTLHINATRVSDTGAAALAASGGALTGLKSLNIGFTKITDAGVAALAAKGSSLSSVTSLLLAGENITDAAVASLAAKDSGLAGLTELSFFNTKVTDAGLAPIAAKDSGLPALNSLNVVASPVTEAGLTALMKVRPGLRVAR